MEKENTTAFVKDNDLYGKQIKSVPKPERNIGIDTQSQFMDDFIYAGLNSKVDIAEIENFSSLSQSREQMYQLLDTMGDDPTIAAALEVYTEDATESNEIGKVVWAESEDAETSKYINYLIDTLNIDKHIYRWVYSLCKYGDLYLRLYRKSELEDTLFDEYRKEKSKNLNEEVVVKKFHDNDNYAHYIEMVPNPAEMFELTRFGKSYAYIQAHINAMSKVDNLYNHAYRYGFRKKDVEVYEATEFVHACLEDNTSRVPEEVDIFIDDDIKDLDNAYKLSYRVRRGQSLLYNTFKIWREMMLLENSLLLNRLTKSSILRVIGVEVGDMPKENVGSHLMGIKNLIEQKTAINSNESLNEYTNPGPMENNIYVPTREGIGAITTQQIGGDVDVRGLGDIDYFKNKFYGAMRIPKQYLGDTDDATGFNGGTSLTIISSRYAKMVKRIQDTVIQAITDCINLMLIDKGHEKHIGKFAIKMVRPTTQEEIDRRDNLSSKVQIAGDIMNLISDVESPTAKLKILKSLLTSIIDDPEILAIIEEEIEVLEEEEVPTESDTDEDDDFDMGGGLPNLGGGGRLPDMDIEEPSGEEPMEGGEEPDVELPNPADLGIDFTDNNAGEE